MEISVKHKTKRSKPINFIQRPLPPEVFAIFPEELWLMILEGIQNHITLQNLVSAVEEFPTVFSQQLPMTKFVQISPFKLKHQFSFYRIKMSRLLDKNWCIAVNNFLLEHSSHFNVERFYKKSLAPKLTFNYLLPPIPVELEAPEICPFVKQIEDCHLVLKELDWLGATHALRPLHLCNSVLRYDDCSPYFDACTALFSDYGHRIHSVTLEMRTEYFTDAANQKAFFQEISNCLQYLPNVRKLSISVMLVKLVNLIEVETVRFPRLPFLRNLQICFYTIPMETGYFETYLLDCFRKSGYFETRQIKTLTLSVVERYERSFLDKFRFLVTYNLKKMDTAENIHEFQKILDHQKKEKVCVTIPRFCSFYQLFVRLGLGQLKTEELHIDLSEFSESDTSTEKTVSLPSVRYLKLLDCTLTGYTFLKALPSLEYLYVQCRPRASKSRSRIQKENRFSRQVLTYLYVHRVQNNCNIWNELPSLKLLIVEDLSIPEKPRFKLFVRKFGNRPILLT